MIFLLDLPKLLERRKNYDHREIVQNNVTVAAIIADEKVITDVHSALELIMTVKDDAGTKNRRSILP